MVFLRFCIVGMFFLSFLAGCKTTDWDKALTDWDKALFGPSESEKTRARWEAESRQQEAENAAVRDAISSFKKLSEKSSLGQSKDDVLNFLRSAKTGVSEYDKPREAFKLNGKAIEIHYFRSAWIPDGKLTDDEFTPLTFVEDQLTAIGWQSLGGARTFGDTASIQRSNAAKQQLLLGILGMHQQQQQQQQENLIWILPGRKAALLPVTQIRVAGDSSPASPECLLVEAEGWRDPSTPRKHHRGAAMRPTSSWGRQGRISSPYQQTQLPASVGG